MRFCRCHCRPCRLCWCSWFRVLSWGVGRYLAVAVAAVVVVVVVVFVCVVVAVASLLFSYNRWCPHLLQLLLVRVSTRVLCPPYHPNVELPSGSFLFHSKTSPNCPIVSSSSSYSIEIKRVRVCFLRTAAAALADGSDDIRRLGGHGRMEVHPPFPRCL